MAAWFLYYALKIGLSYDEGLTIPMPLLLDLIACEQIKHEGFEIRAYHNDDLMSILNVR